jgi:hypothetical protein
MITHEEKATEALDSVIHPSCFGDDFDFDFDDRKRLISAIAAALEEAYKAGRESEAAMWEMAKVGQEIDMCHAPTEQVDKPVSAPSAPLQTESEREA